MSEASDGDGPRNPFAIYKIFTIPFRQSKVRTGANDSDRTAIWDWQRVLTCLDTFHVRSPLWPDLQRGGTMGFAIWKPWGWTFWTPKNATLNAFLGFSWGIPLVTRQGDQFFLSAWTERSEAGQRHIAICLRTFGGKGRPKAGAAVSRHVMGTIFWWKKNAHLQFTNVHPGFNIRFLCGLPKSGRARLEITSTSKPSPLCSDHLAMSPAMEPPWAMADFPALPSPASKGPKHVLDT